MLEVTVVSTNPSDLFFYLSWENFDQVKLTCCLGHQQILKTTRPNGNWRRRVLLGAVLLESNTGSVGHFLLQKDKLMCRNLASKGLQRENRLVNGTINSGMLSNRDQAPLEFIFVSSPKNVPSYKLHVQSWNTIHHGTGPLSERIVSFREQKEVWGFISATQESLDKQPFRSTLLERFC